MQIKNLTTGLAAAILATSVSADSDWNKNSTGTVDNRAKVINNCPYKVYLWSVLKGDGCPPEEAVVLNSGDFYHEEYRKDATIGVSIKISKTDECKGPPITQLEYFENHAAGYAFNFLDVSYVDCEVGDKDCPGRQDGYYLKSGNPNKITTANADETFCPTFQCTDSSSCDKTSYVLPDDPQTKSCDLGEPLDFYLCGQDAQAPEEEEPEPSSAAPSSSAEESTPTPAASSTPVVEAKVAAAEVTSAPAEQPKEHNIKTEVVYVTQYEYVNAKRHAHGHAHRHFRA